MRALLDVNVLIALLDAGHIHHRITTSWLKQEISCGWASCPVTQNGSKDALRTTLDLPEE